jgi:hypothetical protein
MAVVTQGQSFRQRIKRMERILDFQISDFVISGEELCIHLRI